MTIVLYKVEKKLNSTAYPHVEIVIDLETGDSTTVNKFFTDSLSVSNVSVKGNCNICSPLLDFGLNPQVSEYVAYNYLEIPIWNRYYYINSWTFQNGRWLADCSEDVLGSYSTQIKAQQCYVLRSSSSYDGSIPDNKYPTKGSLTYQSTSLANPFATYDNSPNGGGFYSVTVVSGKSPYIGNIHYAMDLITFMDFAEKLYSTIEWADIGTDEISEELQKALINPAQYVTSVVWIPIPLANVVGDNVVSGVTTVTFGYWSVALDYECKIFPGTDCVSTSTFSLTIPKHPEASSRGSYCNLKPYSNYTFSFYPFGSFEIDPIQLNNWSTLEASYGIDWITGAAQLKLHTNTQSNFFYYTTAQVGVSIPFSSVLIDASKWAGGLITGATSLANTALETTKDYGKINLQNLGNYAQELISGVSEDLPDIVSSAMAGMSTLQTHGQNGTAGLFNANTIYLMGKFYDITDDNSDHWGKPLCQLVTLSSLSGYVLCGDSDIVISGALNSEIEAIQAFLRGGCFIE